MTFAMPVQCATNSFVNLVHSCRGDEMKLQLCMTTALISQPMFYHLGHFSKFVPADSVRIDVTANLQSHLEFIGFTTPGPYASTAIVVLNTEDKEIALEIHDPDAGIIRETVPASSIQTYIW